MASYTDIFKKNPLFKGVRQDEFLPMLQGLEARKKSYKKGSFIFYAGDEIHHIGIVLSGAVHIIQEDFWGNRNILARVAPGEMFGEGFACVQNAKSEVDTVAALAAEVLYLDIDKFVRTEINAGKYASLLTGNLLAIMAEKNVFLTQKIRYISQRTTRQKLMAFLSDEARRYGASSFDIAFDRQQLADFLSVDRSAMSSELGRMRDEGIIDFHKNRFTLRGD